MATIETRGYVNKLERKTSAGGKEYVKFTLAVQQKRKDKSGQEVKEKLYFTCVDFSGQAIPGLHVGDRGEETAYVGVTGYITITGWAKDGKGGANLDVTVKSYEALEQSKGDAPAAKAKADAPPEDPFALNQPGDK